MYYQTLGYRQRVMLTYLDNNSTWTHDSNRTEWSPSTCIRILRSLEDCALVELSEDCSFWRITDIGRRKARGAIATRNVAIARRVRRNGIEL